MAEERDSVWGFSPTSWNCKLSSARLQNSTVLPWSCSSKTETDSAASEARSQALPRTLGSSSRWVPLAEFWSLTSASGHENEAGPNVWAPYWARE